MNNRSKISSILMKVVSIADIVIYCFCGFLILIGTLLAFLHSEEDWAFVWFFENCLSAITLVPFLVQVILLIIGLIVSRKNHQVFIAFWIPGQCFSILRDFWLALVSLPLYLICLPILHLIFKWLLLFYGVIIVIVLFKIVISIILLVMAIIKKKSQTTNESY